MFISGRFWRFGGPAGTDKLLLNKRLAQHFAKSYILAEDIRNGRGKVFAGDPLWQVQGPDLAKGERVKVTGAAGVVLLVEAEN